jgi:regulator of nucleoside diphosphate kinase
MTITDQDIRRLSALIATYGETEPSAALSLQEELDRAVVVSASTVEPTIVTMSSRIMCRDESGAKRELQVVYPRLADANAGRVSVLAPLGRALLGASVGDMVEVSAHGGKARTWRIEGIRYQPEAAGDFHL